LNIILLSVLFAQSSNPSSVISGQVTHTNSGSASSKVIVVLRLQKSNTYYETKTDPHGKFRLEKIPAGAYQLEITGEESITKKISLEINAADQIDLGEIDLDEATRLEEVIIENTIDRNYIHQLNAKNLKISSDLSLPIGSASDALFGQ